MQGTERTPAGGDASAGGLVDAAAEFQHFLEGLASAQGRVVASVLLVAALFVGIVVLPAIVARVRSALAERIEDGRASVVVEYVSSLVPTTFAGLLRRTGQLAVLLAVVTSFLVVWDVLDLATTLATFVDATDRSLVDGVATLLLVALAFVASDQLQQAIRAFSQRVDGVTEHQEEVLLRVGQVAIFLTVGALTLTVWDVDPSGLLIGAGFLGIVVGFAARKTLGSLIAGFVLMFSRPFTIGDWVEIGDSEGIVTDITIFNTRLENFDGEFVVLPNDQVSDQAITNRSQKGLLRLRREIGIDYTDDPTEAVDVATSAMNGVDEVIDAPSPRAIPKEFGDSAIVLELRFWIDHPTPPRKWTAVAAVVQEVKTAFDEAGITVPYPQRELSTRSDAVVQTGDGAGGSPSPDGHGGDGEAENGTDDDGNRGNGHAEETGRDGSDDDASRQRTDQD